MRHPTKDEIIEGLREALEKYAKIENWGIKDSNNFIWNTCIFNLREDINIDDCSGFHLYHGEIARQALNRFNELATIVEPSDYDNRPLGIS